MNTQTANIDRINWTDALIAGASGLYVPECPVCASSDVDPQNASEDEWFCLDCDTEFHYEALAS